MITFKQYLLERNFLLPLLAGGAMLTAAIGGAGQAQAPKKPQAQQVQQVQQAQAPKKPQAQQAQQAQQVQAPKKPQAQQAQAAPQQAVSVNKIPQQAVDTIIGFEKCHLKGYTCPSNVPTIGYGNTHYSTGKPVKVGDRITKEQAKKEFSYHLGKKVLPKVEKIEGWNDMNDNQRAALISFAYNVGENFYGHKDYQTISKALKEKRWNDVPAAMKLYNKGGGKVLSGLVRRRDVESTLWSTPIETK